MFAWFPFTVDFDSCSTYTIHELNEDKSYHISWQGDKYTSDCKISFNPYNFNSPQNKYKVCIRASYWNIKNTEVKLKYYSTVFDVFEKVSNIYLTMLVAIGTDWTGSFIYNYHTITITTALWFCRLMVVGKKSLKIPKGNQNPYIEEEQTTQWRKEKVQKGKQRSTKHTYKTKDRVTRTPLKTGGELRYSGRVSSSRSTSGTRRVNLVMNTTFNNISFISQLSTTASEKFQNTIEKSSNKCR